MPGFGSSESRGFARRMCAPIGQRGPARVERVVGEVVGVRERRGSSASGASASGAPPGQRPTIFAASRVRGRVRSVGALRRAVEEAPEAGHVLRELAEHEVAAVAPEVGSTGALGVARQRSPGSAAASSSGRSVYRPYSFG